jgi:hypothetical protein
VGENSVNESGLVAEPSRFTNRVVIICYQVRQRYARKFSRLLSTMAVRPLEPTSWSASAGFFFLPDPWESSTHVLAREQIWRLHPDYVYTVSPINQVVKRARKMNRERIRENHKETGDASEEADSEENTRQ